MYLQSLGRAPYVVIMASTEPFPVNLSTPNLIPPLLLRTARTSPTATKRWAATFTAYGMLEWEGHQYSFISGLTLCILRALTYTCA